MYVLRVKETGLTGKKKACGRANRWIIKRCNTGFFLLGTNIFTGADIHIKLWLYLF